MSALYAKTQASSQKPGKGENGEEKNTKKTENPFMLGRLFASLLTVSIRTTVGCGTASAEGAKEEGPAQRAWGAALTAAWPRAPRLLNVPGTRG